MASWMAPVSCVCTWTACVVWRLSSMICVMASLMTRVPLACSSVAFLQLQGHVADALGLLVEVAGAGGLVPRGVRDPLHHLEDAVHGPVGGLAAVGELLRGGGDPLAHLLLARGGFQDRAQGVAGGAAQLRAPLHDLEGVVHGGGHLLAAVGQGADDAADLLRVARGAGGELADLRGHHGEGLAVLARSGGDDGGVEGEQVGLLRHVLDEVHGAADPARWRRRARRGSFRLCSVAWRRSEDLVLHRGHGREARSPRPA